MTGVTGVLVQSHVVMEVLLGQDHAVVQIVVVVLKRQ